MQLALQGIGEDGMLRPLVLFLMTAAGAQAHQPVLNTGQDYPPESPYMVAEPEVSKAIFSQLTGAPHYYRIDSDTPFDMYVGITAARIEECPLVPFSFDVLDSDLNLVHAADGTDFEWWEWYEPFGRKWYWVGPEFGQDFMATSVFEAGTWFVRVHNADNQGRYILAIGDQESFPPDVILRTLLTLPAINAIFWDPANCQ